MASITIYLSFKNNCLEAFNFYKSVFGGSFSNLQYFKDLPNPHKPIPAEELNKIMHVALPISSNSVLMGSDMLGEWAEGFVQGNNFSISINAESTKEADSIFGALAQNGTVTMPLTHTFWNAYFGTLTDQFGIQWLVNYDLPKS